MGRIFLLFLFNLCFFKLDIGNCNVRLMSVLKVFGFVLLLMLGDGDCFFYCVFEFLMFIIIVGNFEFEFYLKLIGFSRDMFENEKVIVLCRLIVEEFFGLNWYVYELFFVILNVGYDKEV